MVLSDGMVHFLKIEKIFTNLPIDTILWLYYPTLAQFSLEFQHDHYEYFHLFFKSNLMFLLLLLFKG